RTLMLPIPLLVLPSSLKKFIVEAMWFGDLRRHRRGAVSLEAFLVILSLSFALPACVALYPQKMEVSCSLQSFQSSISKYRFHIYSWLNKAILSCCFVNILCMLTFTLHPLQSFHS
ncbi:hypothetical protein FOZ62_027503, partial [Perkinsus olseni]